MPRSVYIRWLLRVLAVVALAIFTYQFLDLARRMDWAAFAAAVARPGNGYRLLLVLVLMPVNWLLEARKWQLLLAPFAVWPFARIVRATLAGVSLSAATPNRVGEIGGRLLLADRGEFTAVTASSLLGGLCQWVAFLLLAWPALVWTVSELPQARGWGPAWLFLPLGPLLVLMVYLGGKPLVRWALRKAENRFHRTVDTLKTALENVNLRLIVGASAYACLRFSVYCTQLYLLLGFFGLELPFVRGLAGIAAIYLVQAGLPLPPGLNLVTRTELGLLLWAAQPAGAVAVLAAYTALFGVNVLLPSIPGYWLLVRKNEKR